MCLSFRPKPLRVANRQPICLKARRGFLATAAPADLVKKVNLTQFDTRSRTTRARYESLPAHYLLTVPSLQSPARYLILLGCHYAATSALSMAQTLVACARKRRDLRPLLDDPQLDQALGWLKKRAAVYRAKGLERKAVHIPLIKMKDIIIATFKRSTTLGCYMLLTFVTASRRADLSAFHLQEIRPLKPPYQRYSSLLFQMSFWKSDRDGMHTCHKVAVIPTELVKLVQRMTKKWDPPSWDNWRHPYQGLTRPTRSDTQQCTPWRRTSLWSRSPSLPSTQLDRTGPPYPDTWGAISTLRGGRSRPL